MRCQNIAANSKIVAIDVSSNILKKNSRPHFQLFNSIYTLFANW